MYVDRECDGAKWVQIWWLENGQITTDTVHPTRDFGLPTHALSAVRGATPALNALTIETLLSNDDQPPSHLSAPASPDSPSLPAIRDYVLLNAAALLHVAGRAKDWKDGVRIARDSIEGGGAKAAFEGFRDASKKAMGEAVGSKVVEDDGGVAAKDGKVTSWLEERSTKGASASDDEKEEE